jgi:hypothetical protein
LTILLLFARNTTHDTKYILYQNLNATPLGFYKRKTISIKRNESNPKVSFMIDLAFQSFSLLVGWFMLGLKCLTGTTFNNISVVSWRSVVLVAETGVAGENHRPRETVV